LPAGSFDQQVSLVDVAPTLLDVAGLAGDALPPFEGRSLRAPLCDGRPEIGSLGYAEFWAADSRSDEAPAGTWSGPVRSWLSTLVVSMPQRFWYPQERMLRSPTGKVVLRGGLDELREVISGSLSDEEFVVRLFSALWGFRPSAAQVEREVDLLQRGELTR